MRLTHLLGVIATLSTALALHADKWASLAASSSDGIIKLDSATYDEILAEPREYGVALLLTALPAQFNCAPCREFDPTFRTVAKNWQRLPADQKQDVLFASLDFPDGQAIYQRLGLQTAPTMQYFPPTTHGSKPKSNYEFQRLGFTVEAFHNWLRPQLPHEFTIHKPFDIVPYIVLPLLGLLSLGMLAVSYPYIWPILQTKVVWMIASLLTILVFTSGHMWNRIRGTPYSANGQLVAGGFMNQFGAETDIVAGLYGTLALATVILTVVIPSIKSPAKQRAATLAWMGVMIVLFSVLVKLFKVKNGGYPFRLLFG